VLKEQRRTCPEYWSDYLKEAQAFETGDSVIGTTWKIIEQTAAAEKAPVKAILPSEGSTGWSDTWMISSQAAHPNCAYAWMSYITEPKPQSEVAQYFGEAPANGQACKITGAAFCKAYHVTDQAFSDKLWYWTTPISQCLDGRTNTHVHRLRRLDPGLDRDQGIGLVRTDGAGPRPGSRAPAGAAARALRGLRTGLLLLPPMLWLGVAYLAALGALFITSLWEPERLHRPDRAGLDLRQLPAAVGGPVYRTIAFRTIGIAALVTVIDAVLAFPIALYMAKVASPRCSGCW
jgi:hypothetical protein